MLKEGEEWKDWGSDGRRRGKKAEKKLRGEGKESDRMVRVGVGGKLKKKTERGRTRKVTE